MLEGIKIINWYKLEQSYYNVMIQERTTIILK